MIHPRRVYPSSCSPRKTYTGLVQTSSGTHQRIIRRVGGPKPWVYEVSAEEGETRRALDTEVFEVFEIDPGVNDQLQRAYEEIDRLNDALDKASRCPHGDHTGITPEQVREIAREEIAAAESAGREPSLDDEEVATNLGESLGGILGSLAELFNSARQVDESEKLAEELWERIFPDECSWEVTLIRLDKAGPSDEVKLRSDVKWVRRLARRILDSEES